MMSKITLKECTKAVLARYFSEVGEIDQITNLRQFMLDEVERQLIIATLDVAGGNKLRTAKILGVNRNTLRSKMDYFKLTGEKDD